MKRLQGNLLNTLMALILVVGNVVFVPVATAGDMYGNSTAPTGETMAFDAILVRPAMLVGTVLGFVTFVGSLPFSILGGNVDEAGKSLVLEPAEYTFVRPLGDF